MQLNAHSRTQGEAAKNVTTDQLNIKSVGSQYSTNVYVNYGLGHDKQGGPKVAIRAEGQPMSMEDPQTSNAGNFTEMSSQELGDSSTLSEDCEKSAAWEERKNVTATVTNFSCFWVLAVIMLLLSAL